MRWLNMSDPFISSRSNTHTGRLLASDSFISKLEKVLNKRLRPLPAGRPKKSENYNENGKQYD